MLGALRSLPADMQTPVAAVSAYWVGHGVEGPGGG
jgi:hypothetical protein